MAGMDGLGRVFNIVPAAQGLYIAMRDCSAVSFICTSTGETFAFGEAKNSSGGSAQLFADGAKGTYPPRYYEASDTDGSVAWVKHSMTDDTTPSITSGHCIVVTVYTSIMDDGYDYVYVTPGSSGTAIALLHDLTVQRTPANLALPGE